MFTLQQQVREEDIDALSHTNNLAYARICERAAWAHSCALGIDLKMYQKLDRAIVVSVAEYNYLAPSYLGENLCIATWLVKGDSRLSLGRRFLITREMDQALLLKGRWLGVCTLMSSGKLCRMPPEFVSSYTPAMLEAADAEIPYQFLCQKPH
ncbi:acyl-CoA thioesterase [Pseudomaricurvus alkylphenolicus]|nr:acyl-CoA thioesterase [Pseudomaricurvus alkylphenolicus]